MKHIYTYTHEILWRHCTNKLLLYLHVFCLLLDDEALNACDCLLCLKLMCPMTCDCTVSTCLPCSHVCVLHQGLGNHLHCIVVSIPRTINHSPSISIVIHLTDTLQSVDRRPGKAAELGSNVPGSQCGPQVSYLGLELRLLRRLNVM